MMVATAVKIHATTPEMIMANVVQRVGLVVIQIPRIVNHHWPVIIKNFVMKRRGG